MLGALASGACSIPLDSMFSKQDADGGDITGSIGRAGAGHAGRSGQTAAVIQPSEADLAYVRTTAADVLASGLSENSVPWQNPQTGIGGNITLLSSTYSDNGLSCRDFLVSYGRSGSPAWLQGSACRSNPGEWQVRSLRPLKSG